MYYLVISMDWPLIVKIVAEVVSFWMFRAAWLLDPNKKRIWIKPETCPSRFGLIPTEIICYERVRKGTTHLIHFKWSIHRMVRSARPEIGALGNFFDWIDDDIVSIFVFSRQRKRMPIVYMVSSLSVDPS